MGNKTCKHTFSALVHVEVEISKFDVGGLLSAGKNILGARELCKHEVERVFYGLEISLIDKNKLQTIIHRNK